MDYSYFTDPVSCEVSNSVGSTNVSTLVDVQCKCNSRVIQCSRAVCFYKSPSYFFFFFTPRHSAALILTVCFVSSRPSRAQTAVGAQADDSGHRDGCSLYMCVDWKPSSDAGLDKAWLERGKETNT